MAQPPMPCTRRPPEWVTTLPLKAGSGSGGTRDDGVDQSGEAALAVKIVGGKRRSRRVAWVGRDRTYGVEIKGLAIEDVTVLRVSHWFHQ
jgi:hypothetical protein